MASVMSAITNTVPIIHMQKTSPRHNDAGTLTVHSIINYT